MLKIQLGVLRVPSFADLKQTENVARNNEGHIPLKKSGFDVFATDLFCYAVARVIVLFQ